MIGIVWSKTFASAIDKLDQIAAQYEWLHIYPIRIIKSKNEYNIVYENGDYYECLCVCYDSKLKSGGYSAYYQNWFEYIRNLIIKRSCC